MSGNYDKVYIHCTCLVEISLKCLSSHIKREDLKNVRSLKLYSYIQKNVFFFSLFLNLCFMVCLWLFFFFTFSYLFFWHFVYHLTSEEMLQKKYKVIEIIFLKSKTYVLLFFSLFKFYVSCFCLWLVFFVLFFFILFLIFFFMHFFYHLTSREKVPKMQGRWNNILTIINNISSFFSLLNLCFMLCLWLFFLIFFFWHFFYHLTSKERVQTCKPIEIIIFLQMQAHWNNYILTIFF